MKRLLVTLSLIALMLAGCGSADPTPAQPAVPTSAEPVELTATATPIPPQAEPVEATATTAPTDTPTLTPTPSPAPTDTPEPTATPAAGSYQQPVPFGQPQQIITGVGHLVEITVTGVLTGPKALAVVNTGNDYFPEEPDAGKQYAIVRVDFTYLEAPADPDAIEFPANGYIGWGLSAGNQVYGTGIVLSTEILAATLLPGGTTSGWVIFEIPQTAAPDRLRYDLDMVGDTVTWFALSAP